MRVWVGVQDLVDSLANEERECRFGCHVELSGRPKEGIYDSRYGSGKLLGNTIRR